VPHIVSISFTPADIERRPRDRYARAALDRAELVEGHGIEGDAKGGRGQRQLNILLAEIVEQLGAEGFRTGPGELGEQLVIAGLSDVPLLSGVRLQLGASAVVEVASTRTGCERLEHIQGRPRDEAQGRIGVMARVIRGGTIAVGDAVRVETTGKPNRTPEH
jgi:molybdopterin adenylyltransferase